MNPAPSLLSQVRALVDEARRVYEGTPAGSICQALCARLDEPLRVAIAGKVKAGKSTLLNALVGESLAPTDAGECTRIVTWYRKGITYKASFEQRDGTVRQARFSRDGGALEVFLDGTPAEDVERLIVDWPSSALSDMTLIDTPGIGSLSEDAGERTRRFLSPSEEVHTPADAVIYLMRHLHSADARFLETFHDDRSARAAPVNAVGVLSRADEIGGARADALRTAHRIAQRYRTDANVRRLCQTVVPVAGLLAQLGGTLTEGEYRAVVRIGTIPEDDADALLISADRFLTTPSSIGLAPEERAHLIDRFGLYGLRLTNALARGGRANSTRELAEELRRRSGLDDLRRELTTHFAARRDVLKARSTLLALEEIMRRQPPPQSATLGHDIERVIAGAHELAELRLLTAVRSGAVRLDPDEEAEVERLLGATGTSPQERLGLAPDAENRHLRTAVLTAHQRWAQRAESPLTSVAVAEASRIVQRTYEGLLAGV
jgi:hypothetical protein